MNFNARPRHSHAFVQNVYKALVSLLLMLASAFSHAQCSVNGGGEQNLGQFSTLTFFSEPHNTSFSSGFSCQSFLNLGYTNRGKYRVEVNDGLLKRQGGSATDAIPYSILDENDDPLPSNQDHVLDMGRINIFGGPGDTMQLKLRIEQSNLQLPAGKYVGTIQMRWYYWACFAGAFPFGCLSSSSSPGFKVSGNSVNNWGTGTLVTLTVSVTLNKDCMINAPSVNFGSAPLVAAFNPVTQTLNITCSAGADYTVGMDNGKNVDAGTRRMRMGSGNSYLRYELFKSASGNDRWGNLGSERRHSSTAEVAPGIYDGSTTQGFVYRAVIEPTQATPPPGTYTDNIVVDVDF
ncbi:hypothetical protein SDC9_104101 [bioreactor metagenome]|uniref:Spore coat protein U/FanG domain-containing protein n=1 Tax=bioreactor metagenome TaxID=1076179 RepID=A0A645AVY9_9ZZZZ